MCNFAAKFKLLRMYTKEIKTKIHAEQILEYINN